MALSGGDYKLETEVEIKSNADKLYAIVSAQHHTVPKASSALVSDVAVHEGDWETSGSVKLWNYNIDGTAETLKEKVEFDEAKKYVSLTALEGSDVLKLYPTIRIVLQVIPKSEGEGGSVKIAIEYGKKNENDQPPNNYLQFLVNVIQDIDAHLLKE